MTADSTPTGTPISVARQAAMPVSRRVSGARSASAWATVWSRKSESPSCSRSRPARKVQVLHRQRRIEAEPRAQRGDVGGGGVAAEHDRGRVARDHVRDDEDDAGDDEHDHDHAAEAAQDVAPHAAGKVRSIARFGPAVIPAAVVTL